MKGDTIRRFNTEVDTGYTKINWWMDTKGTPFPSNREPDKDQLEPGGGPQALPGTYKVVVKIGDQRDSVMATIIDDPRTPEPLADRQARFDAQKAFAKNVAKATAAYKRLKDAEKTIALVEGQWVNVPDSLKKDALKLGSATKDSIGVLKSLFFSQKENQKGIQPDSKDLNADFGQASYYISESMGAPNQNAQIAIKKSEESLAKVLARVDKFFAEQWKPYREKAETVKYSLFKE
jgi:hypothetical protein